MQKQRADATRHDFYLPQFSYIIYQISFVTQNQYTHVKLFI